jgi:hypothetical protein
MTRDQLDEIIKRYNSATPGPWRAMIEGRDHTSGSSFIMTGEMTRGPDIELTGATDADLDFIAHARQDIPTLVEEIVRLRILVGER